MTVVNKLPQNRINRIINMVNRVINRVNRKINMINRVNMIINRVNRINRVNLREFVNYRHTDPRRV